MFNPHEFQYHATLNGFEGDLALLNLKNGSTESEVKLPKNMIPEGLQQGSEFTLKLLPHEDAKESEFNSLRKLLMELIS